MSLPHCYHNISTLLKAVKINTTAQAYDFTFPKTYEHQGQYLHNIYFHTHPLLLNRQGDYDHYRLSTGDVNTISLIIDNQVIAIMANGLRYEPVLHRSQIGGVYSSLVDFFYGQPLITGALKEHSEIKLRITFWREPVSPFWLSYEIGYTHRASLLRQTITVPVFDGSTRTYNWGMLSSMPMAMAMDL